MLRSVFCKVNVSFAAILMLVAVHSYAQMSPPCEEMLGHIPSEHVEQMFEHDMHAMHTSSESSQSDCCDSDCQCPTAANFHYAEFDVGGEVPVKKSYPAEFFYAFSALENNPLDKTKPPIIS